MPFHDPLSALAAPASMSLITGFVNQFFLKGIEFSLLS
jgi:hypothetical protein